MVVLIRICLIITRCAIAMMMVGATIFASRGRTGWRWPQWAGITIMNICTIFIIAIEFIHVPDDGTHRLPVSFEFEDLMDTIGIAIFAIGYAGEHLGKLRRYQARDE